MEEIVLMSDPRVSAVEVEDCDEPLVDCRGTLRVDERRSDTTGSWASLRSGVLERLVRAEELLPDGRRWLLVEGHRPPQAQQRIFDGYLASLRRLRPGSSESELTTAAARWVAPLETAGHVAGAAVDLTMCTAAGVEVDMGCPEAATPEESGGACYTDAQGLPDAARRNRAVMGAALRAAGLVNYPTEWWHWSYGDRYWALLTGAGHAIYGPRELR
ncbi:M15 family metallopeptidase [Streptomyces winkii]|uniref:M15 family metallopeptidase n=1 Tax=Streptomyces winkii TaxID=3051178 RepID=UPI0028D30FEF|nr:M15 family metallopeptidase [Streptomyces sp. DSM 40971]